MEEIGETLEILSSEHEAETQSEIQTVSTACRSLALSSARPSVGSIQKRAYSLLQSSLSENTQLTSRRDKIAPPT